jgi:ubiquinone/menaquinone biosynthesis C-methylase UbiE
MQVNDWAAQSTDPGTPPPANVRVSQPSAPSLDRSNRQYDALSDTYDALTPRLEAFRNHAHALLRLGPGMTVVDNGCGTGKSLPWLSKMVGPNGRVIGLEPSEAMFARACRRVESEQLGNVELHRASATSLANLVATGSVDAYLLMFTHDVLQSNEAIAAMLDSAKSGTRFALAGGKFYSGVLRVLNPWVEARQRPYCTTFEGYDAPWRKLFASPQVEKYEVFERYFGISYVAHCTLK